MKINGKTALVAGASRGIGLAIARKLAAEGAQLVLPWFDRQEDCEAMRREFIEPGGGHLLIEADLRKKKDVEGVAEKIRRNKSDLHILVNNIERGGMPVIHGAYDREVNRDQWQLEIDTSLLAKRLLFEHSLPLMRNAGEGAVVNISSIAGLIGRSGPAGLLFNDGYASVNRGIRTLTETWARMAAPDIRVNEIMLGIIDSRHGRNTRGWEEMTPEQQSDLINHTLLQRTGTPEEVADTVLFVVRDATYMTGTIIRMDGGYLLGGEKFLRMPEGIL